MNNEIPLLILSHIRWLDHIIDLSTIAGATMECLSVLSFTSDSTNDSEVEGGNDLDPSRSILLELITTLPEIVDDDSIAQDPEQMSQIITTLRHERFKFTDTMP